VFTLRPTARLLKRLRVPLTIEPRATTTRLGDWYANLLHVGRQQLVLAVSEKTLLPVVVPATPHPTLVPRLRVAVAEVLDRLAIASEPVEQELASMAEGAYGKTTNRQVLGVMVDLAKGLPFYLARDGALLDVSMTLAAAPCSPRLQDDNQPGPDDDRALRRARVTSGSLSDSCRSLAATRRVSRRADSGSRKCGEGEMIEKSRASRPT
jgi:hypothetical protein